MNPKPKNTRKVLAFPDDRRENERFPLRLALTYKTDRCRGTGRTANFGSHGLLVRLDKPLPVGMPVTLAIEWPVTLDAGEPLTLVIGGSILRADAEVVAISTERYEFKMRGKAKVVGMWPLSPLRMSPVLRKVA